MNFKSKINIGLLRSLYSPLQNSLNEIINGLQELRSGSKELTEFDGVSKAHVVAANLNPKMIGALGEHKFAETLEELLSKIKDSGFRDEKSLLTAIDIAKDGAETLKKQLEDLEKEKDVLAVEMWIPWSKMIKAIGYSEVHVLDLFYPFALFNPQDFKDVNKEKQLQIVEMQRNSFLRSLEKWRAEEDFFKAKEYLRDMQNSIKVIYNLKSKATKGYQGYWLALLARIESTLLSSKKENKKDLDTLMKDVEKELTRFKAFNKKCEPEHLRRMVLPLVNNQVKNLIDTSVIIKETFLRFDIQHFLNEAKRVTDEEENKKRETFNFFFEELKSQTIALKKEWEKLLIESKSALENGKDKVSDKHNLQKLIAYLEQRKYLFPVGSFEDMFVVLSRLKDRLPEDSTAPIDIDIGKEISTLLVLFEMMLVRKGEIKGNFAQQVETQVKRCLLALDRNIEELRTTPVVLWDEETKKDNQRSAVSVVLKEVQNDLKIVTTILSDVLNKKPGSIESIKEIDSPIKMSMGALKIIKQDNAIKLLGALRAISINIHKKGPDYQLTSDDIERIKISLSSIGVFLTALEKGDDNAEIYLNSAFKLLFNEEIKQKEIEYDNTFVMNDFDTESKPIMNNVEETHEEAEHVEASAEETHEEAEHVEASAEETHEEAEHVEEPAEETHEEAEHVEEPAEESHEEAEHVEVSAEETHEEAEHVEASVEESREEAEYVEAPVEQTNEEVGVVDVEKTENNGQEEIDPLSLLGSSKNKQNINKDINKHYSDEDMKIINVMDSSEDPEIAEIFMEEVEYIFEEIKENLKHLKVDPSNKEYILTIRRQYHTLKGSGRMADFKVIGEVAWRIEEYFNQVRDDENLSWDAHKEKLVQVSLVSFGKWFDEIKEKGSALIDARDILDALYEIKENSYIEEQEEKTLLIPEPTTIDDILKITEGADGEMADSEEAHNEVETEQESFELPEHTETEEAHNEVETEQESFELPEHTETEEAHNEVETEQESFELPEHTETEETHNEVETEQESFELPEHTETEETHNEVETEQENFELPEHTETEETHNEVETEQENFELPEHTETEQAHNEVETEQESFELPEHTETEEAHNEVEIEQENFELPEHTETEQAHNEVETEQEISDTREVLAEEELINGDIVENTSNSKDHNISDREVIDEINNPDILEKENEAIEDDEEILWDNAIETLGIMSEQIRKLQEIFVKLSTK